jgi:hypothetical protein
MSLIGAAPRTACLLLLATVAGPVGSTTAQPAAEPPLEMAIRVFDGETEVTDQSVVDLHAAGTRNAPIPGRRTDDGVLFGVPPGSYDAQAILERDGRVVAVRWAERLTAVHYPDEAGRHLEVVNFQGPYGALQVRRPTDPWTARVVWEAMAFRAGDRSLAVANAVAGAGYAVLALPAGSYDIAFRDAGTVRWFEGVEVIRGLTSVLRVE